MSARHVDQAALLNGALESTDELACLSHWWIVLHVLRSRAPISPRFLAWESVKQFAGRPLWRTFCAAPEPGARARARRASARLEWPLSVCGTGQLRPKSSQRAHSCRLGRALPPMRWRGPQMTSCSTLLACEAAFGAPKHWLEPSCVCGDESFARCQQLRASIGEI